MMLQCKPMGLALSSRGRSAPSATKPTPANTTTPARTSHAGLMRLPCREQPGRGALQRVAALGPAQEDLLKARSFRRTVG